MPERRELNEDEKKNCPILKEKADYICKWPKSEKEDFSDLVPYVQEFMNKCINA